MNADNSRGAESKIACFRNRVWKLAQTFHRVSITIFEGEPKIGLGQLLQTVPRIMLQLYLVVQESFVVVNKLTGPTDNNFIILFYCFCNVEHFSMP